MTQAGSGEDETYSPWSIVNLVFHHLAQEGLHPILGDGGDPGGPAAELLRSLGIRPAAEGNRQVSQRQQDHLAQLRAAYFEETFFEVEEIRVEEIRVEEIGVEEIDDN